VAVLAGAAVLLLAGAGAAAYAALTRPVHRGPVHVILASAPPPPVTTTPNTAVPPVTTLPKTPAVTAPPVGAKGALPPVSTKPPKIPALAPTPAGGAAPPAPKLTPTPTTQTTTSTTTTSTAPAPNPLTLDTNAAGLYNPEGLPPADFGEPDLAIDGEAETGWTAAVDPATAPHMTVGLVLDLRTPHHLGSLEILTTSPGTTVAVYGANGQEPPVKLTDPGWAKLNPGHLLKKQKATMKLHANGVGYRYVLVWLTKAPAGARRVSLNELALFPPAK
jgi:hypothetical protein